MLVPIAKIRIGSRLRGLREPALVDLQESIARIGLRVPISVATGIEKRQGDADGVAFLLVAGAHRVEACRRLGWEEIEASIVQMSADEQLLWEIDENLCRAELTELERGEHLTKRKEVYERLHPQSKQHIAGAVAANEAMGNATDNSSVASFAADSAGKTGASDRDIRRSIRRVTKIDEKVRDRIRSMPEIADSGVELDALAELAPAEQRRAVALVEDGQALSIRDARRTIERSALRPAPSPKAAQQIENAQFSTLMRAWNTAAQSARDRFLLEIGASHEEAA